MIYESTIDKKVRDLTVREEQQVKACQAFALYPPADTISGVDRPTTTSIPDPSLPTAVAKWNLCDYQFSKLLAISFVFLPVA